MAHKICLIYFLALLLVNNNFAIGVDPSSDDYDYDYDYDYNKPPEWLSPWEVHDLPQEPRPDFYRDLRSCLQTLTQRCNDRLYNYALSGQEIRRPCCKKVYAMEVGCLESLAWVLIRANYEYRARHVDERFKDVLTMCSGFD
ncbi:putative bifunctional inhibitor/plant lipid transfer protein/seed storage helical domain superfamily [Helianthus annuus]|nr:putative bifunctional inhibitor/plant lipid transfer protein/seed storage helical domain superfamily [Helianthus annuus]